MPWSRASRALRRLRTRPAGPSAAPVRPTPRRAFLTGAAALTGTAALSSRPGIAGAETPILTPAQAGGASSATFLRGDQVWSDTLTGGLSVTGATGPEVALEVGNGARLARLWSAGDSVHLSTSDSSPIRIGTQVRWDSDDTAALGGSGFNINRPATVWRQTGEKHKGAMLEFQQWLEAGTHPYGIACNNVGRTFEVPTAGHKRVGWILSHYDSPTPEQRPIHQHMNFETCKADLSTLITRFQISWGEDVALCSFPNSDVRMFDNRELRFGGSDAVRIRFDPGAGRLAVAGRPWAWGDSVSIDPTSGRLGVGTSSPSAPVHIQRASDGNSLLVRNTSTQGNTGANIVADAQTLQSRLFHGGLQSDGIKRLSIEASGRIEWGPGGTTARDTNLYRHSTNTLATDDDLRFDAAGRGPIVRSPNGTAYRITVSDDGRLGTQLA